MLTRIRNAGRARKKTVRMPLSRLKLRVAEILAAEGYVDVVETDTTSPKQPILVLTLTYREGAPAIHAITRESKPGFRMYRSADEIPRVMNGYGIAIVSTSRGLMTNREAKKLGIGGEIICSVY